MSVKVKIIICLCILGCIISCVGIVITHQEYNKVKEEALQYQERIRAAEEKYQSCAHDFAQLQVQLDTKQQELDALKKN